MNTYDEILKIKELAESEILKNNDPRTKEVGDRVIVWDGSGNIDKQGIHRCGIDPLFSKSAIVIETNCNIIYTDKLMCTILEQDYFFICDLLLKFESGEEVYCCSRFVKII